MQDMPPSAGFSPAAPSWTPPRLLAALRAEGIAFEILEHPPIATVEAARPYWDRLTGEAAKNLFLRDAARRFWLVFAPAAMRVDLKALPGAIGSRRLSFAPEAMLEDLLGVMGGAVTPLAAVNDTAGRVRVVVDSRLAAAGRVLMHPLVNTATVTLSGADLVRFLARHGHPPTILELPTAA